MNFITITLLVFIGNFSGHERGVPLLRSVLATVCTCIWAIRLGVFLLIRIFRRGSDERFDGIRSSWWRSAIFWIGQGTWVWTVSLPVLLLNQSTWQQTSTTPTDKFGLILWVQAKLSMPFILLPFHFRPWDSFGSLLRIGRRVGFIESSRRERTFPSSPPVCGGTADIPITLVKYSYGRACGSCPFLQLVLIISSVY